jgi:hypothetical protein
VSGATTRDAAAANTTRHEWRTRTSDRSAANSGYAARSSVDSSIGKIRARCNGQPCRTLYPSVCMRVVAVYSCALLLFVCVCAWCRLALSVCFVCAPGRRCEARPCW